jgi:bacterioferritin-associated ferredoxin
MQFHVESLVMSAISRLDLVDAALAPMTRCECSGLGFDEIERRMEQDGLTLAECSRRTGCGDTCTACLRDLETFLRSRMG